MPTEGFSEFKLSVGKTFVRFEIKNDARFLFIDLERKLKEYHIHFPVYFQDREGDWCGINTGDELVHALHYSGNNFLKLYPSPSTHTDTTNDND